MASQPAWPTLLGKKIQGCVSGRAFDSLASRGLDTASKYLVHLLTDFFKKEGIIHSLIEQILKYHVGSLGVQHYTVQTKKKPFFMALIV